MASPTSRRGLPRPPRPPVTWGWRLDYAPRFVAPTGAATESAQDDRRVTYELRNCCTRRTVLAATTFRCAVGRSARTRTVPPFRMGTSTVLCTVQVLYCTVPPAVNNTRTRICKHNTDTRTYSYLYICSHSTVLVLIFWRSNKNTVIVQLAIISRRIRVNYHTLAVIIPVV